MFGLLDIFTPDRRNNVSLENPRISLQDPRALKALFGRETSSSGVVVSPMSAIGHPAIWRGTNLLGNAIKKTKVYPFRESTPGNVERATEHPAWRLMRKPNPLMTGGDFRKTMLYHAVTRGNGYAAIVRTGDGRPMRDGLLLLDPTETKPEVIKGQLYYHTTAGGMERTIHSENIFHLMGLSYNGIEGLDVISILSDPIGCSLAAKKFAGKFFSNGAHAGGFLQMPAGMTDAAQKRLKDDMRKKNEGLDNAFRTALLEEGAKWVQTTIAPEQAQLIATQNWGNKEVALILGLPPHKLGDDSKAAYNSLEQENKSYLEDSLDPWFSSYEEEADEKLLTEDEQLDHYFSFDTSRLQRASEKEHTDTVVSKVNNGLWTLDEARAEDNKPPLPNGAGKKFRRPANIIIDGEEPPPPPPGPAPVPAPPAGAPPKNEKNATASKRRRALRAAHNKLIDEKLARFTQISAENCTKQTAKEGNFVNWAQCWFEGQAIKLQDALEPIMYAVTIAEGLGSNHVNRAHATAHDWKRGLLEKVLTAAEVPQNRLADSIKSVFAPPPAP